MTGNVVVDFQYDRLESTGGGYFIATKGDQMGVIDTSGNVVRPLSNCHIQMRNQIIAIADENGDYTYLTAELQPSTQEAYYGSSNSRVTIEGYNWVEQTEDGYYLAHGGSGTALLDANQQVVIPAGAYDSIHARCVTGGKTYYEASSGTQTCILDNTGTVIVPMGDYSYIGGVNSNGLVAASTVTRNDDGSISGFSSILYNLSGQEVTRWTDREVTTETYFPGLGFHPGRRELRHHGSERQRTGPQPVLPADHRRRPEQGGGGCGQPRQRVELPLRYVFRRRRGDRRPHLQ